MYIPTLGKNNMHVDTRLGVGQAEVGAGRRHYLKRRVWVAAQVPRRRHQFRGRNVFKIRQ